MTGLETVLLGIVLILLVIVTMQGSTINSQGVTINRQDARISELAPDEVESVTVVEREAIDLQAEAQRLADYKAKRTRGEEGWRAP
jgi:hypothetical protein